MLASDRSVDYWTPDDMITKPFTELCVLIQYDQSEEEIKDKWYRLCTVTVDGHLELEHIPHLICGFVFRVWEGRLCQSESPAARAVVNEYRDG